MWQTEQFPTPVSLDESRRTLEDQAPVEQDYVFKYTADDIEFSGDIGVDLPKSIWTYHTSINFGFETIDAGEGNFAWGIHVYQLVTDRNDFAEI